MHWVPLPAPGPPRTNTTRKGSLEEEDDDVVVVVDLEDLFWRYLT